MMTDPVYRAFEDIVGADNINRHPAVMDGYAFYISSELISVAEGMDDKKFISRPEAVILPENIQEVQAIMKACNRYGVRALPFCNGLHCQASPGRIHLDLRRMGDDIEIDVKNKIAVISPYVSNSQLFRACIKKGLRAHVHAGGPYCSPLASATSVGGEGPDTCSTGYSSRVVLGVEWVLPTGEILRLGSLGSGAGWFSGDGPGPSLRGIMRGMYGAFGGLGVFTKVAVKLFPWAGPPRLTVTGNSPHYIMEIPDSIRMFFMNFPNIEKMYEAGRLFFEENFLQTFSRMPAFWLGFAEDSNQDHWELWKSGVLQDEFQNGIVVTIEGRTQKELSYKEKLTRQIMKRNDGKIVERFQNDPKIKSLIFNMGMSSDGVNRAFRISGSLLEGYYLHESTDVSLNTHVQSTKQKQRFCDLGACVDTGESNWGSFDDVSYVSEHIPFYDPSDPKSVEGMLGLLADAYQEQFDTFCGSGLFSSIGAAFNEMAGPYQSNVHIWKNKIKTALDPNAACEASGYAYGEFAE